MRQRVATALLLTAVVVAARPIPASAQAAPNPTQQTVAAPQTVVTPQGEIPVFRVTVVGRTVPAINYRPALRRHPHQLRRHGADAEGRGWATMEGEEGVHQDRRAVR